MNLNRTRISFNQPHKDWSGILKNQNNLIIQLHKLLRLEMEAKAFAEAKLNDTNEWWWIWAQHCDAVWAIRAKLRTECSKEDYYESIIRRQRNKLQRAPTFSKRSPIVEREHKSQPRNNWILEDDIDIRAEIDDEIYLQAQEDKAYADITAIIWEENECYIEAKYNEKCDIDYTINDYYLD